MSAASAFRHSLLEFIVPTWRRDRGCYLVKEPDAWRNIGLHICLQREQRNRTQHVLASCPKARRYLFEKDSSGCLGILPLPFLPQNYSVARKSAALLQTFCDGFVPIKRFPPCSFVAVPAVW